jgi:predicted Zn-dependent protease
MLRILSKSFKAVMMLCIGGLAVALSGCAPAVVTLPSSPSQQPLQKAEESVTASEKPSPRALAALQFTEQGRLMIEGGNPDDAIVILERSLNLYPTNGLNYYYLAEAWLMKENFTQANEFNRLAEIYLQDNSEWLQRVLRQRERIQKRKH